MSIGLVFMRPGVAFPDPHHPYTPPGRYRDMYRPEDVGLLPSFHLSGAPLHLAWLRAQRDAGAAVKHTMACFAASEREAIALSHGSIAFIDDNEVAQRPNVHRLILCDGPDAIRVSADGHVPTGRSVCACNLWKRLVPRLVPGWFCMQNRAIPAPVRPLVRARCRAPPGPTPAEPCHAQPIDQTD